jgi:site-specific DNA-methyltransferase (adenine-specific)
VIDLHEGDMRGVLAQLAAAGARFDACVTDPPYHLTSIVKRFGAADAAPAQHGTDGAFARASRGFMGQTWDGGDIAFQPQTWRAVFDALKPGAHLVAFGGSRTFHRIAVAIEDAGFEIRDTAMWLYGCGFPKSHDVAKGIDKALGQVGSYGDPKSEAHAGRIERGRVCGAGVNPGWQRPWMTDESAVDRSGRRYIPATAEAARWQGWGTALKPAFEPIIIARRPIEGSVARNVLAHGAGALNIDACRVPHTDASAGGSWAAGKQSGGYLNVGADKRGPEPCGQWPELGRWPANVLHDGSDEVLAAFAAYGEHASGKPGVMRKGTNDGACYGAESTAPGTPMSGFGDSGSASRFFYCAKADAADRADSRHPTVKPIDLMRWLVRLVAPPGATVLDPFAGSGTTAEAAMAEGCDATLIELRAEGCADIRHRIARWSGQDAPLFAQATV